MKKIYLHPTQQHAKELMDICRPLEKLNINYFAHAQVDAEGHFAALNNNPELMHYYLDKRYYNADIHMAQQSQLGNYVLWDNIELQKESDSLRREAIQFGVDHTFTIIEKNSKGMQYYHFASNRMGKSINQEYLRNLDLLKVFILYFNEQVSFSSNLSDAYSSTFLLSSDSSGFLAKEQQIEQPERDVFLQQIKLCLTNSNAASNVFNSKAKELISTYYQNILSKREIDCLLLTLLGKTAKLIGLELGISPRTVEEHLASIKNKLKVFSKAELIEKVLSIL